MGPLLNNLNSYTPPKYDYTIITNAKGRNVAIYVKWGDASKIFTELKTLREKNDIQSNKTVTVTAITKTNIIISKTENKLQRRKKAGFFGIGVVIGILLSNLAKIAINSLIN